MSRPQPLPSLVGSVVERPSSARPSFNVASSAPSTGFPSVQHRSKSAFARAREAKRSVPGTRDAEESRIRDVPIVQRSGTLLFGAQGAEEQDVEGERPLSNGKTSAGSNSDLEPRRKSTIPRTPLGSDEERWKMQMTQDNERAVDSMTEAERERHRAEILEQLGPEVGELLRRVRDARTGKLPEKDVLHSPASSQKKLGTETHVEPIHTDTPEDPPVLSDQGKKRQRDDDEILQPTPNRLHVHSRLASPPRGILVSSTPPTSRSSTPGKTRKLRFADVTPDDVHVFQSEPSSPRRPVGLLLPPPPDVNCGDVELIEDIKGNDFPQTAESSSAETVPEEGTPEDIRRRFFPNMPAHDPNLEWIEAGNASELEHHAEPRFDLSGALVPPEQWAELPTHLGLHHHGGPSAAAGYTFVDLLLLARSSVPAQRASVLGVLTKLVRRLVLREPEVEGLRDSESIRARSLAVGLAALAEKGSLVVQAINLVWTCVVFWDEELVERLEGVELRPLNLNTSEELESKDAISTNDPLSSLPFPTLLGQIASHLDVSDLPRESLSQLLSITHRLARHSVKIANAISETPQLVGNIVRAFLLTPIPPSANDSLPDPLALRLLHTLAISSRANAKALEGPADALLRFVTTNVPLSTSPFPRPLAEALLCGTLDLYAVLARYGVYAGVATTAAEHFGRLSASLFSEVGEVSDQLRIAWLCVLDAWMVCARDPHRTTPTHDLLWSQVIGWTWGDDLLGFRKMLLSKGRSSNERVWASLWGALAAWLEGCRVNSAKAGQGERNIVCMAVAETWSSGLQEEKAVITGVITSLRQMLSNPPNDECAFQEWASYLGNIDALSWTLSEFTRLCLACVQKRDSSSADGDAANSTVAPSWVLDAHSLLLSLAHDLISHPIWNRSLEKLGGDQSKLVARIRCLHLQSSSVLLAFCVKLSRALSADNACLPLGIAVLERLLPGEEEIALRLIDETSEVEEAQSELAGKFALLRPFFKNLVRPDEEIYLSPRVATPNSIQLCTTQCLPAEFRPRTSSSKAHFGLPLSRDWPCVALDHLLRSGTSAVLTNPNAVPESWSASETELVQASLSLLNRLQTTLRVGGFDDFTMSMEHAAFTCMKVFMLEHNQQQSDSSEEVFRDTVVGRLMDELLKPFSYGEAQMPRTSPSPSVTLEDVSKGFLGAGTPFYQFYTDFIALYDAISLSHRTFARLLLPPTSMAYAIDYRKHLWGDFGHVVRTIQTPIDEVLAPDLKSYLWPSEMNAEMLGWYLRALTKWPLSGFVRFVAVHHVASSIWPDLQEESGVVREKRARMLLHAVVGQTRPDVVKDIAHYTQTHGGNAHLPPKCYECSEDRKSARLTYVKVWGDTQLAGNLSSIFAQIQ
ncbi:hypothetical protein DFH11DRAFT_1645705 [Phellopilus nigrolimitatus]|nr:hypothetical protein DFH11DRAFT_1645705 [Phellopilus nigrolimitatus]